MVRRWAVIGGWVLGVVGFGFALASLALPWATYRVSADVPGGEELERSGGIAVFQIGGGFWYVLLLFAVLGLFGSVLLARGRAARAAGVAALLLAVAGMILANVLAERVSGATTSSGAIGGVELRASPASGVTYGTVALPLLGLGTALLSVRKQ